MAEKSSPVVSEALPFIVPGALLTLFFFLMGWWALGMAGGFLTLFIAYFFRNPRRRIPEEPNAIVAPADGKIIQMGEVTEDRFLRDRRLKLSIFMNLFDVHINRMPASGTLVEQSYRSGKFSVASGEKTSLLNEQNALVWELENRIKILLVQVAGFVARRIVCYARTGDTLKRGEIFGMIRFGSRVDLYLPPDVKTIVRVGQHVRGGESILGYFP